MDIILLGGSFDPVHIGHVKTVSTLQSRFPQARILILPGQNRLKNLSLIPLDVRIKCAQEVFKHFNNVQVLDWSLNSDTTSTYAVYLRLTELYPKSKVSIFAGEDILETLKKWKNSDKLISSVNWIFFKRLNGVVIDSLVDKDLKELVLKSEILEGQPVDISSTDIRSKSVKPEDYIPDEIIELVRPYLK